MCDCEQCNRSEEANDALADLAEAREQANRKPLRDLEVSEQEIQIVQRVAVRIGTDGMKRIIDAAFEEYGL